MGNKKSSTTNREQIVVSSYVVVTKESKHFESQDHVGQVLKLIAFNPNIDNKYICVDAFGLYNWGNIGFMNGYGFDNQPKSCCKEVRLATKEEIEAAKGSKIDKEALLEEAKKRYPIGTDIMSTSGKVYKISTNSVIQFGTFNPYRICVYDNVSKAVEAVLVVAGENNWIEIINKEERRFTMESFKVDDWVIILYSAGTPLKVGDVGKVVEVDKSHKIFSVKTETSDRAYWFRLEHVRHATPKEISSVNKEEKMSKSVIPPAQEEFFEKKLEDIKAGPTTNKEFFELHKWKIVIARSVIKGIVIGYHKTDHCFVLVKRIDGGGWLGTATQEGQKSKMLDNYIVEYEISQSDKFWALHVDELTVTDNPATTTEPEKITDKVDLNAILEEAKRRYPVGTRIIPVGRKDRSEAVVRNGVFIADGIVAIIENCPTNGSIIYDNGKWAEIVELPKTKENMSYIVKQEDLIGQLEGFPIEVVQRMVDCQVEQGNPADVTAFQMRDWADYPSRGFDWVNSSEKTEFWTKVILGKNFKVFFDRYPKQSPAVIYEPGKTYEFIYRGTKSTAFKDGDKIVGTVEQNGKWIELIGENKAACIHISRINDYGLTLIDKKYQPGKIYEFVYRSNCEDVVEFFIDGNKYKGIVSKEGNYIHFSCGPNSISIAISYIERHGLTLISESLENSAITEHPTSITLTKEMLSQLPKGSLRHIAKLFGKDYEIIPDSEVIISDIFNAKNNGKSS